MVSPEKPLVRWFVNRLVHGLRLPLCFSVGIVSYAGALLTFPISPIIGEILAVSGVLFIVTALLKAPLRRPEPEPEDGSWDN